MRSNKWTCSFMIPNIGAFGESLCKSDQKRKQKVAFINLNVNIVELLELMSKMIM